MNVESLNNILKLKEWTQETIEIELGRLARMVKHHEETLKAIESEYEREISVFKQKILEEPRPDSIKVFHAYFSDMNSKITKHKEILRKRIEELKQTEQRLLKAYRERSLVEKLVHKELNQQKRLADRSNQKMIDELATKRFCK